MSEPVSRPMRLFEMLPVMAALAVHAYALDRAPIAIPAILLLFFCAARNVVTENTTLRLFVTGTLGALAGGLMLLWSEPAPGPIPGPLLSILAGMLVGLAVSGVVSRSILYSWIYAWLLAIVSLHVAPTPMLSVLLGALALGTLVATLARGRVLRADRAGFAGAAAFLGLAAAGTFGLGQAVVASEGFLVQLVGGTIAQMLNPPGFGGIALQDSITIGPRGSVERSSTPLFELSGAVPTRVRTSVMDRFDGFTWSSSPAVLKHLPAPPRAPDGVPMRTIGYAPLENLGAVVPAPGGTRAIDGGNGYFLGGNVLRADVPEGQPLTLVADASGWLLPEAAPGAELLSVPANLAAELEPLRTGVVPDGGTARQRANAAEAFFQANFEYSLETNLVGKAHPLVTLIKEKRPAYCIYFASAMATMLRLSGIPARVVGGFVADEQNPLTGDITVRTRDAHAWVEAWLPDEQRWETYDPTPSRSREALLERDGRPGWISSSFRALASYFRREWKAFKRDPADFLLHSIVAWLVLLGGVGFFVWQRRPGRRAAEARSAMRVTDAELEAAYRRYVKALKIGEIAPSPAETDDEVLTRIDRANAEAGRAARTFVERYREARYRTGVADAKVLAEAVEAVERAFGRAA